jgi:hypothetical protein
MGMIHSIIRKRLIYKGYLVSIPLLMMFLCNEEIVDLWGVYKKEGRI